MGQLTSRFLKTRKKRIKPARVKKVRFAIDEKEDDRIVRAIDDNIREMGIKEEIEEELEEEDESDSDENRCHSESYEVSLSI
ncbi:unnamed protein product, partial [Oikopleura dioica]